MRRNHPPLPIPKPDLSGYLGWVQYRIHQGYLKSTTLHHACLVAAKFDDPETFLHLAPDNPIPLTGSLWTFEANLADANAFVLQHHRHHRPVVGCRFVIGVHDAIRVRGYAIVGRPVARAFDPATILEVTRLVTDGTRNACSKLYGAVCRHVRMRNRDGAHYEKVITYTLNSEHGASLKAAGFSPTAVTRGGGWSCPSRPRSDRHPLAPKIRWERKL